MIIGITGHQEITPSDNWGWVETEIEKQLGMLPTPLYGVSCLAVGADQLFASCVLRMGGEIDAVIPFPGYEYRFAGQARLEYFNLLNQVRSITVLDKITESDEEAYWNASQIMVSKSSLVIAVWDGLPAAGLGGTADVVDFAIKQKKELVLLNPVDKTVDKR